MKRIDLITSLVLVPIDYVMLVLAAITSYSLRYQGFVTQIRPVFFDYPFREFFPLVLAIAAVGIIFFAFNGLYSVSANFSPVVLVMKVFMGVSTTMLVIIVSIFLRRELFSSRFVIILAWFLAVAYVFISRLVVTYIKSIIIAHGVGAHGVIILGQSKAAEDIAAYFKTDKASGVAIRASFPRFDEASFAEIKILAEQDTINEILVTEESINREQLAILISFCHEHNIVYRYVASVYQMQMMNFETDSIAGYPIIQINKTSLVGWGRVLKRLFDLFFGLILLIVLSPLFPLIAMLIRMDSKGPIFVKLMRVGRGGKPFMLYKFRSMVENALELRPSLQNMNERNDGPLFKIKADPRITRIGRFLRHSSLDELPQLVNVLRGEMSLVGPRPHNPDEVERYERGHRDLLAIKPGMTGMSQVSGRSRLLFSEEVKLDLFYVENWSLLLDLQILFKTIVVIFNFSNSA